MSDQGDYNNNENNFQEGEENFDEQDGNYENYDPDNQQENYGEGDQQFDEDGNPQQQYDQEDGNYDPNYDPNYDENNNNNYQEDGENGDNYQGEEGDNFQGEEGEGEEQGGEEQEEEDDEEFEEDDFPEYANEQNKQLHEIIKEKKRLIKEISRKADEKQDRTKVLSDHLKSVQTELLHTQALIDQKNKEIETEDHLKQVNERQIGRIESEFKKIGKQTIEWQEKLNDVQNQIFKGNEQMDQQKLNMNWNQEELEQWALAARQKEEDNLTLEKYKRADEVKIKELNLQIQRLTSEVGKKQSDLAVEITETQTAQIELDKTAEEFKKQHEERHKLFLQWQEVTEVISRRDQAIREAGEEFASIKMEINANKDQLDERNLTLKQCIDQNKKTQMDNELLERQKISQIGDNKFIQEQNNNLRADVEILKNQVSAFASDLAQKRNKISVLTQERLIKKQRLNAAQQKYNAHKIKMKNEDMAAEIFKKDSKLAEERYQQNDKTKQETETEIRKQKEALFRFTQELFKLREKEANLYGDIQGNMAACRNLKSHINNLNQEFQRQQELLYNAEYQIQLMERKVARANGERTLEEKKDLENEIQKAEAENTAIKSQHQKLEKSLNDLEGDLRAIDKRLTQINQDKDKFDKIVAKLILENDMTYQDLNKIVKRKEDILVNHDTMKLEIKKIQDTLSQAMNVVAQLENKKYQLEMSMQEREKEIQVHKDVLVTENKAAEEERHKIAVELAERKTKVKNLKIKYESLVQKNVASNGEIESVHEHSQAFYVIKAAQEREELQRKGDELNAKLIKSEKELKALDNTLNHLKGWNSKFYDSFMNKGVTPQDRQQKDALDAQCRAASENLFKKKKDLQKMQQEYVEDMRRFTEIQNKIEILNNQMGEVQQIIEKTDVELEQQDQKKQRAYNLLQKSIQKAQQKQINLTEENPHIVQLKLEQEQQFKKTLMSGIYNLSVEIPELAGIIEEVLKENEINLPSKAPSSIDVQSQRSIGSVQSQQSRGSRQSSRSRR